MNFGIWSSVFSYICGDTCHDGTVCTLQPGRAWTSKVGFCCSCCESFRGRCDRGGVIYIRLAEVVKCCPFRWGVCPGRIGGEVV